MAYLVLVRHGKSEWNEKGLWTGWMNIDLNETGEKDAKNAAEPIKDIKFDKAYTSTLTRAKHTWQIIKENLGQDVPTEETRSIDERNYGIYTGKNKWEVKEQVGEEEFQSIRRSWNHPIPEGETMEMVYNRVVPFYENTVLPQLKDGKNIIMVAHGNSLRALVKYLEDMGEEELMKLEVGIGEVYVYEINSDGKVVNKEIRAENAEKGKV